MVKMNRRQNIMVSAGWGVNLDGHYTQNLGQIYDAIQKGFVTDAKGQLVPIQPLITKIRKALVSGEKNEVSQLKKRLYSFTLSGTFSGGKRKIEHFETHSGRLQLDFDHLGYEAAGELKNHLAKDPHIELAAFSPSNTGLKAALLIPPCQTKDDHHMAFEAAKHYIKQNYGFEIDPSTKDLTRLFFITYDEDAFVAGNLRRPLSVEEWKPPQIKTKVPLQQQLTSSAENKLAK